MIKKIIAISLITLLALVLASSIVQAYTIMVHYSISPGGWPGPDNYCECDHTDYHTARDCEVGIGITGTYDTNYPPPGPCHYSYGSWVFVQSVSYNYLWDQNQCWYFYPNDQTSHSCTYSIKYVGTGYYTGTSYYDTNIPHWDAYTEYGVTKLSNYPSNGLAMQFSPDANALNGQSYGAFYKVSDPTQIRYMSAGPTGSYYNIVTAQPYPSPTDYYYYINR
jgi:hypothetical protein